MAYGFNKWWLFLVALSSVNCFDFTPPAIECSLFYGRNCAADFACVDNSCKKRCLSSDICAAHEACIDAVCRAYSQICDVNALPQNCHEGWYCNNGQCAKSSAQLGELCTRNEECSSNNCVDGVCCNHDCRGACHACRQVDTGAQDGICHAVLNGRDPHKACAAPMTCNGAGSCDLPQSGEPCVGDDCLLDLGAVCSRDDVCKSGTCFAGYCSERLFPYDVQTTATADNELHAEFGGADLAGNTAQCFNFSGSKTVDNVSLIARGGQDFYVVSYDKNGKRRWLQQVGTTEDDGCSQLFIEPSGRVYVGAFISAPYLCKLGKPADNVPEKYFPIVGASDAVAFAFAASDGSISACDSIGTLDDDRIESIFGDETGGYLIMGQYSGTVYANGLALTASSDRERFVFVSGQSRQLFAWPLSNQGTLEYFASGSVFTLIAGTYSDTLTLGGRSLSNVTHERKNFVARLRGYGAVVDLFEWPGSVPFVRTLRDGSLLIAGRSSQALSVFGTTLTVDDAHVMNLDKLNGSVKWLSSVTGAGEQKACSATQLLNGNIVIMGEFVGVAQMPGTDLLQSNVQRDVFFAEFGSDGVYHNGRSFGGSGDDFGRHLRVDDAGNLTALGVFTGDLASTQGPVQAQNGADYFWLRLTP